MNDKFQICNKIFLFRWRTIDQFFVNKKLIFNEQYIIFNGIGMNFMKFDATRFKILICVGFFPNLSLSNVYNYLSHSSLRCFSVKYNSALCNSDGDHSTKN